MIALSVFAAIALSCGIIGAEEPDSARYMAPDGTPLPFGTDAEVLEFLRTATVVGRERVGIGVNNPERLVLEQDGVQARAIFRDVEIEVRDKRVGNRFYFLFRDSYWHECGAYLAAQLFELGHVPPVVPREIEGTPGSVQLWIEDTVDESSPDFKPSSALVWVRQMWEMALFDNLVANVDRNPGNLLVDGAYRLWLIDHTRAFQTERKLIEPDRVNHVSRRTWALLQTVTVDQIEQALREYLGDDPPGGGGRLRAFDHRRQLIIERLQSRIDEHGEHAVLY